MIPMTVGLPKASTIIRINHLICTEGSNPHLVLDLNRIESAIHSAFYPGFPPFAYGGIARLAGALCFYLTKGHAFQDGNKRTAVLTAITFMNEHGWELVYPLGGEESPDALADLVDGTAAGSTTKDEMIEWFERHKRLIEAE
jgi:death-on-curing protein